MRWASSLSHGDATEKNVLSSLILVKVHFDVVMTMIADTMHNMLAQKLRGFQDCDAPKIYRHFVKGKANITVKMDNNEAAKQHQVKPTYKKIRGFQSLLMSWGASSLMPCFERGTIIQTMRMQQKRW
jgi:hypothetical protein